MSKTSSVRLYGLIGYPVKHSLSPAIHNAAFKATGINAEYRLFAIRPGELEGFLLNPGKKVQDVNGRSVRAGDIEGFNITVPHKVRALEILKNKFPFENKPLPPVSEKYYVRLSGAVNTVKRSRGMLGYWNTDSQGFLRALREDLQFDTKGKNIVLMGCGGAGRAIIAALSWQEAGIKTIYVYDIDAGAVTSVKNYFAKLPKGYRDALEKKIKFINGEQIPTVVEKSQLLINASPVGMREGDPSVIKKDLLHHNLYIYDIVYNRKTELIKEAKKLRLQAQGGLGMLLYQGVAAWELWTKQPAPVGVMRQALNKELLQ